VRSHRTGNLQPFIISMKALKNIFNAENAMTFGIVVAAVIVAGIVGPMVVGWFTKARAKVGV